jgi:Putative beta-barrel porin-2, OmpL-like. bbp2
VDYWRWDGSLRSAHGNDDSIGGAVYVVPHFGKFSLPLRLEYIDQGESQIYLDSVDAKQIYTATVSPTYHILDNAYVRADLGYVHAEDGFTDKDGNTKSGRVCIAAEIGYTF